jgi:serine/threonine-protein kinase
VFAQHLQTLPTPPSQLGQVTVPADLEHLILTCLAKKPEDRPQSAAALDRLLATVDVEPWTDVDARQWWESSGALSDDGRVGSGSVDQTVGQSATRPAVDLSETSAAEER